MKSCGHKLDELLDRTGARDFVTLPLVSEHEWEETMRSCPIFLAARLASTEDGPVAKL